VIIRADGGALDISPVDRLTGEMIEGLKRHKPEILELLKKDEWQLSGKIGQMKQIKPETPKERNYEVSRQKAIALMNESPDTPRGIYVDEVIDPFNAVVFVASRATQQTCWLTIRRDRYDPFKLLELIERLGK